MSNRPYYVRNKPLIQKVEATHTFKAYRMLRILIRTKPIEINRVDRRMFRTLKVLFNHLSLALDEEKARIERKHLKTQLKKLKAVV